MSLPKACLPWLVDHRRSGIGFSPSPCPEGTLVIYSIDEYSIATHAARVKCLALLYLDIPLAAPTRHGHTRKPLILSPKQEQQA